MASRTKQKEEARARRLAEERARAERERRQKRGRALGGIVVIAVIIVGVAIAISSGGSGSNSAPKLGTTAAKQAAASVNASLSGIPQSGTTIGSPSAPVTVTEYGDLECPICKDFATGTEQQLIAKDVKAGKVKLTYRSLETASQSSPISNVFPTQQAAAVAAGNQGKAWNYILLFYRDQGTEGTSYVNTAFLTGLAKQVPGLNYQKWNSDRFNPTYASQIQQENKAAASLNFQGQPGTPALIASGPSSQTRPVAGNYPYSSVQSMIKSVS